MVRQANIRSTIYCHLSIHPSIHRLHSATFFSYYLAFWFTYIFFLLTQIPRNRSFSIEVKLESHLWHSTYRAHLAVRTSNLTAPNNHI